MAIDVEATPVGGDPFCEGLLRVCTESASWVTCGAEHVLAEEQQKMVSDTTQLAS